MKKRATILVVDDNKEVLDVVTTGLASLGSGYSFLKADGGKKCLNILKKTKPDLVLLDIMMPDMDGWDVCVKIKSNKKTENIPVVFLTAKTDVVSKHMGELASSDYIEKPFDIDDLHRRIQAVLKKNKKK